MVEQVATILRVMARGGGFASLVETSGGHRAILKLCGVGQGPTGLTTELIATRLARACGLNSPTARPIFLSPDLPWQTGTDEFYDSLQRSVGWNLAITYLDGVRDVRADDLSAIPGQFLDRLADVDALLQNVDRTAHNPNLLTDVAGNYWAIDFGACRFLERFGLLRGKMKLDLPKGHFLAGRTDRGPPALTSAFDADAALRDIPDAWLEQHPGGRTGLHDLVVDFLDFAFHAPH